EGWQYVFEHPDECTEILIKRFKGHLDTKVERRKLDLIRTLMCNEDGTLSNWSFDEKRIEQVMTYLKDQDQIDSIIPVTGVISQ
ncbi:MAG: hypothetical protein JSW40_04655, partial [Candidatus Omnitrophota bacterium]